MHDLRDSLTKAPLALQDTQAATSVIRILASELLYSTLDIHLARSMGPTLCSVLSQVQLLRGLTADEMAVIYGLAMRRLERSVDYVFVFLMPGLNHSSSHTHPSSHTQTSKIFCRPWEVAIIGLGSMGHRWLEEFVLGPCGIPSLILVLDTLLEMDMDSFPEGYIRATFYVLKALGWLVDYGWIAEMATEHVVAHIVTVLV